MACLGHSDALVDQVRDGALQAVGGVEAGFRERLRREGTGGEWRFSQHWLPETIALQAR